MKADIMVVYSGWPSATNVASASVATTAALPLSYIPMIVDCTDTVPSTGRGRCRVTACWPWTNMAGLKVPMLANAPLERPKPITTGKVGSTCWGTPEVFSVV
jgi:hypothetical protein